MNRLAKRSLAAGAQAVALAAKNPELRKMLFNGIRLGRPEVERLRRDEACRFLAYALANRHRSRSQILQDLWVCFMLDEKRDGIFVEFGATNGLTNSNTWLLEKRYGWRGVLAEPNPVWHEDLRRNRNAAIDTRCVHADSGRTVDFMTTDGVDPELSCIAEFASGDHFAEVRATGSAIPVETISLNDLLKEHQAPSVIDFMSIDTEGSELAILSTFDFDRYRANMMCVEQNPTTEPELEALLRRHGYVRVLAEFSQWDGWYVHESLRDGGRSSLQGWEPMAVQDAAPSTAPARKAGLAAL